MVLVLVIYDWLLYFGREVRFIWNWRSRGVTISTLVYTLSRYPFIIKMLLVIMTIYPMLDLVRPLAARTTVSSDNFDMLL